MWYFIAKNDVMPLITAALFISHLVNCWQRTQTPQPVLDDLTDLIDILISGCLTVTKRA